MGDTEIDWTVLSVLQDKDKTQRSLISALKKMFALPEISDNLSPSRDALDPKTEK
jgi:hypothetical protein